MTCRLLPTAIDDLSHIEAWVAANFGEAAAVRVTKKFSEVFALLARHPQMGVQRTTVTSRPIRFFSTGKNWIVYELGEPLQIHRVFPATIDIGTFRL